MVIPSATLSKREHLNAIRTIAAQTRRPEEEVRKLYAEAFERLSTGARVKDFLVVLTSREVRELLEVKVTRR